MAKSRKYKTPFDRLRDHYREVESECPECGFEDDDPDWKSSTDGSEVRYQHMCSNCGHVRMRSITLSK